MKRYFIVGELNGDMLESSDGEYVRYEDVKELLNWLQAKSEEWQSVDYGPYVDCHDSGKEMGYEEAGLELEQKLNELGITKPKT